MSIKHTDVTEERIEFFLKALSGWAARNLRSPGDVITLMNRISEKQPAFYAQKPEHLQDAASDSVIRIASYVAAGYVALRERGCAAESSVDALTQALAQWTLQNKERYTYLRLGISKSAPEQAFAEVKKNFKQRGEERFGSHFVYEQDVLDDSKCYVNITRCLYNDYFRALGYPEATKVFCAMDILWAEEATQPMYRLHFERPTTLAQGQDKCRFQFSRQGPNG